MKLSRTPETPAINWNRGSYDSKRAKLSRQPCVIVTCMLLSMVYFCPTANGTNMQDGASSTSTPNTTNTTRLHNASVIEDRSTPKGVPPTTSEQSTTSPGQDGETRMSATAKPEVAEHSNLTMSLETLFGPQLVATNGNVASVGDTKGMLGRCKHVIVYFTALWCKHCAVVTQLLETLTKSLNTGGQRVVEVVLVSSDRTEELYLTHLTAHPWIALPFGSREIKQALRRRFDVRGIPSLVVIDAHTAHVVTYDGLSMLKKDQTGVSFPWSPKQPPIVTLNLAAGGFDMHGDPCTCESEPRNTMSAAYETPQRRWVPPDPVAPSSKGQKNYSFDPSLTLEVFVTPLDPEKNDGNTRFLRSTQVNAINVHHNTPTFGTENFLKRLFIRKTQPGAGSVVVVYIHDAADVIFAAEETEILREFESLSIMSKGKVIMAAQRRCSMYCQGKGKTKFVWPSVEEGARFADAHMLVGRLDDMLALAASIPAPDNVTINLGIGPFHHVLTLYSTLNSTLATDGKYALFQNLAGFDTDLGSNELELHLNYRGQNDTRIRNAYFNTWPGIIYGAGNQLLLDQIGNYVPLSWSPFVQPIHNRWTFDCSCWAGICGKNCSSGQILTSGASEAELCDNDDTATCLSSAHTSTSRTAPLIVVTIMVGTNAPFFDYMLEGLETQNYPKDRIHIDMYVFERVFGSGPKPQTFTRILEVWCNKVESAYASFTLANFTNVSWAVNESLRHAAAVDADRWLFMTNAVVLNNSATLRHLVHQNKTAIAPLMTRDSQYFSTFWGSTVGGAHEQCYDEDLDCVDHASKNLCVEGDFVEYMQSFCAATCGNCTKPSRDVNTIRYKRSFDYFGIVGSTAGRQKGIWTVPVVHTMIMFNRIGTHKLLQGMITNLNSTDVNVTTLQEMSLWKYTLQMVEWIHAQNGSTFVTNAVDGFGTLINSDFVSETMIHPELYLFEGNEALWKRKYLHENYSVEEVNMTVTPTCWDVYQFPLLSTEFCAEFIEETETFAAKHNGVWGVSFNHVYNESTSPATHHIELWKYGFHKSWASVLQKLIAPVLSNIFNGYVLSGNVTADYIIRYNETGNTTLRTHHDPSTFSVNLALSQGDGVDYSGGGTHFVRQNCSVDGKMGHVIIHPGMFTHQHEALAVTNGTRYVVISYIDQV
eukprot:m.194393 g.194393  ORF g.194393 m.194393 type:complete len:1158 (-) comp32525_c1_seq3:46-3519(-)